MSWTDLIVLAALGYVQRSLPWVLAERIGLPGRVQEWLRYVAPAAFATIMVSDVSRASPQALVSLVAAAFVSWRTRNLGLAVLAAVAVGLIGQLLPVA